MAMEQCNKEKCFLPLPNGQFSYNELGIISAQEYGFDKGWKAALEWVKAECIKMDESHTTYCDVYCNCYNNVLDTVEEELGDE